MVGWAVQQCDLGSGRRPTPRLDRTTHEHRHTSHTHLTSTALHTLDFHNNMNKLVVIIRLSLFPREMSVLSGDLQHALPYKFCKCSTHSSLGSVWQHFVTPRIIVTSPDQQLSPTAVLCVVFMFAAVFCYSAANNISLSFRVVFCVYQSTTKLMVLL